MTETIIGVEPADQTQDVINGAAHSLMQRGVSYEGRFGEEHRFKGMGNGIITAVSLDPISGLDDDAISARAADVVKDVEAQLRMKG